MIIPKINIIVVGLGYVGLPLAVEFGKKYRTFGLDINQNRINELQAGLDKTLEVNEEEIKKSENLCFINSLESAGFDSNIRNVFIVTVPTPIDAFKKPDLRPLLGASKTIGKFLNKEDVVVYESTVFPGCTEEDCVPVLEEFSGLKFNTDFYCGYSPERINPGDKVHTVTKIRKVTSGSTPEIAEFVDNLYASIIEAGTFKAASIKIAEAAKIIENCQRDINIAFVNELSLLFNKMDIDTQSVLEAARTKWNFLDFRPGLVGGHCIGVDPYYLTYKAESLGYHPEVILAGRRINDSMGKHVATETIKLLIKKNFNLNKSRILVLGITFKENCPDIRNSKVIDIIREIKEYNIEVDVYDPWASSLEVKEEYGIDLSTELKIENYSGIVMAVNHKEFNALNIDSFDGVVFDVKGQFTNRKINKRL